MLHFVFERKDNKLHFYFQPTDQLTPSRQVPILANFSQPLGKSNSVSRTLAVQSKLVQTCNFYSKQNCSSKVICCINPCAVHFQSLHIGLNDILGHPETLLFPFMQFMKGEASVNVLQFYLTVGRCMYIYITVNSYVSQSIFLFDMLK